MNLNNTIFPVKFISLPMASTLFLFCSLMFCQLVPDLACIGGGGGGGGGGSSNTKIIIQQTFINKRDKSIPKEHWIVPDNLQAQFGDWMKEYMANQTLLKKMEAKLQKKLLKNSTSSLRPGELAGGLEGKDVPDTWKGYGPGFGGQDPPPWAIIPEGQGKPDYCFLDPDAGECGYKIQRWGFNSYAGRCFQFEWSGCGGNFNNYKTRERCEEMCANTPETCCQKYEEYKHYDINDTTYKLIS